jgi:hypothetical protein
MGPIFFETPQELRTWLEQNHHKESELLVGFYRKSASGRRLRHLTPGSRRG